MRVVAPKPSSSMARVAHAACRFDLEIEIHEMPESTRTAQEAADACGCDIGQIVKSLIFKRADNTTLVLVLVSGAHNADMERLAAYFGTELQRADPRKVRNETGFAIGGIAPIGYLRDIETIMAEALLDYQTVWAAAGRPNVVFSVDPVALRNAIKCKTLSVV